MKSSIRYLLISIGLMASLSVVHGQNYIGLTSVEIAGSMKTVHPQFKLDKSAVNHSYKYLKYVDKISEQTILFFMSDKDVCTYVRWMSDYSNLNDMIETLNREYRKSGANSWTFSEKGQDYSVTLVEDEWYFTVNYRKN
jgi:hypothetical protein